MWPTQRKATPHQCNFKEPGPHQVREFCSSSSNNLWLTLTQGGSFVQRYIRKCIPASRRADDRALRCRWHWRHVRCSQTYPYGVVCYMFYIDSGEITAVWQGTVLVWQTRLWSLSLKHLSSSGVKPACGCLSEREMRLCKTDEQDRARCSSRQRPSV